MASQRKRPARTRTRTVSAAGLPLGTIEEQRARAKRAGKLDCYFCGLGYNDFSSLAYHVANDCKLAPRDATNQREQENATMAKKAAQTKDKGAAKFAPFLKPDDVGGVGEQATLTFTGKNRFNSSQYGEQLVSECKMGNKTFDFAIKAGSKNHKALQFLGGMPKKGMAVVVEVQTWDAPDGRTVQFLSIVSA